MGNCNDKSRKYTSTNAQEERQVAYARHSSSLANVTNWSSRYTVFNGSGIGNSTFIETSQNLCSFRRRRIQDVSNDQLSFSKTKWPIPQFETAFLPEFKINETASTSEFKFIDVISKGAYGQVYKVRRRNSGEIFALKVLNKAQIIAEDAIERVKDEVRIQQVVGHHPFVVKTSCHWQDKRRLYVGSDYVPGGELFSLVQEYGSLPEEAVRILVAEVALAIDFLHNAGIIHRDVKASNILLDDEGHAQLIDFGFAKWLRHGQKTSTLCGTPHYIAPEILKRMPYGHAVDWWSLGVLMFFLLTAEYPLASQSEALPDNGVEAVTEMSFSLASPNASFSPAAADLIKRLLEPDPASRLRSIIGLQRIAFYKNCDFRGYTCRTVSPLEYLPATKKRSTVGEGRDFEPGIEDALFAGFSEASVLPESVCT